LRRPLNLHEADGLTTWCARQRHPGAKHSLDALCTRFGVDRSLRVKHGALIDAQLLAQVYVELRGGRQIGLSLAAESRSAAPVAATPTALIVVKVRPPRPHAPSLEEIERHAAFLRGIVDPIWSRIDPAQLTDGRNGA
jgi:DNA polymerase-3 subunit epsilon